MNALLLQQDLHEAPLSKIDFRSQFQAQLIMLARPVHISAAGFCKVNKTLLLTVSNNRKLKRNIRHHVTSRGHRLNLGELGQSFTRRGDAWLCFPCLTELLSRGAGMVNGSPYLRPAPSPPPTAPSPSWGSIAYQTGLEYPPEYPSRHHSVYHMFDLHDLKVGEDEDVNFGTRSTGSRSSSSDSFSAFSETSGSGFDFLVVNSNILLSGSVASAKRLHNYVVIALYMLSPNMIIDVQGFTTDDGSLVAKELAFLHEEKGFLLVYDYEFEPPYPFITLSSANRKKARWLTKHYHGLKWNSGDVNYKELKHIINRHMEREEVNSTVRSLILMKGQNLCDLTKSAIQTDTSAVIVSLLHAIALINEYKTYFDIDSLSYFCNIQDESNTDIDPPPAKRRVRKTKTASEPIAEGSTPVGESTSTEPRHKAKRRLVRKAKPPSEPTAESVTLIAESASAEPKLKLVTSGDQE
uniref:Uncharacterized protein n=1 Tax=Timema bartmani TaxID=61472 RepID=A0A7R9I6A5_9NEOP|nr:unnamed protein product [Timema bartmani]